MFFPFCAALRHKTHIFHEKMSAELGVPVLDGVVSALIIATGLVKAGYTTSKIRRYKAN